jgi:dephospho-CoA kinase
LNPVAVGFSGKIGSGKSEVSCALASKLGWRRASFGEHLRALARARGLSDSREVLQALGESLVAKDIRQFCQDVLFEANWTAGQGVVVDGIRHVEAIAALRDIVAPLRFFLVLVETPESSRQERLFGMGVGPGALRELELHSTERQVSSTIPGRADMRVDGTRKPLKLVEEIIEYLRL